MKRLGLTLVGYGAFLIVCGLSGYALTRETSASAIVNGVVFGSLMMVMGVLLRQGRPWTLPAPMSAVGIFTLTFIWRGAVQWMQVVRLGSDHAPIAGLLTLMTAVSALMALSLYKRVRT